MNLGTVLLASASLCLLVAAVAQTAPRRPALRRAKPTNKSALPGVLTAATQK
jgi:hypothetical protein